LIFIVGLTVTAAPDNDTTQRHQQQISTGAGARSAAVLSTLTLLAGRRHRAV